MSRKGMRTLWVLVAHTRYILHKECLLNECRPDLVVMLVVLVVLVVCVPVHMGV